ncbi:M28 family peptidase [Massilia sp. PWRC2]|uniref:M28 family peptidase n=1 Tax=Massilia sp. PWRC2 TaxID=2804626 RepID=UPI003CEE2F75
MLTKLWIALALALAALGAIVVHVASSDKALPSPVLSRAMHDVAVLASAPRPIASAANGEARAHIISELTAMGLAPQVQTALAQHDTIDRRRNLEVALGMVHNVVVLIAGSAPDHASRPALLLATAYDSGARSVGAGASAAPTAALLEALRLFTGMPAVANDIVVLFADGEQVGGLGSRAFASAHPLAGRIGLVVRFDGAGSEGAPLLVHASGGSAAAAVHGWATATRALDGGAHGAAALQGLYQTLPGIQMGALATLGSARLQLANVAGANGGGLGSRDTVARLAPATLVQTAATMLALARQFGDGAPLSAAASAQTASGGVAPVLYFTLPLVGVVSYGVDAVWTFTRLACLMLLIVCGLAVQRGEVSVREIIDAALGFVAIAAVLVLAAALVWGLLPSLHRGYDAQHYGAGSADWWFVGAYSALGSALFVLLQRGFRRVIGQAAAALGPLLAASVLLLVLSWQTPQASYVLVWPLIGTLLAYGLLYAPRAARLPASGRVAVLGAGVLPALLIIGPLLKDLYLITSPEHSELPMLVLALLLGMASVLLTAQRRFIVRGLGLAGLACLGVAGAAAPYGSAPLPQPNRMVYLQDGATWRAYWMMTAMPHLPHMPDVPMDAWARAFFPASASARVQVDAFGANSRPVWLALAPRAGITVPALTALSDNDDGSRRQLRFRLDSKPSVPAIDVSVRGADAFRTSVNGRLLSQQRSASYTLHLYGMQGQRLEFAFDVQPDKRVEIDVDERTPGLPAQAAAARPPGLSPPLTPMTATTIARDRLVFR